MQKTIIRIIRIYPNLRITKTQNSKLSAEGGSLPTGRQACLPIGRLLWRKKSKL